MSRTIKRPFSPKISTNARATSGGIGGISTGRNPRHLSIGRYEVWHGGLHEQEQTPDDSRYKDCRRRHAASGINHAHFGHDGGDPTCRKACRPRPNQFRQASEKLALRNRRVQPKEMCE
ncbi:hypothetical protein PCASD_08215 [Puccinia coronata f. sp. avenae]|uniref:Uncharacterized protein n=1 Tax=Puccinia coronata f. sp. avenae TaxID=200324 RepID=A0A2N5ULJ0_9BASI|nr:hypothetical protein PCASD_08215 [Puccinia coronata f. sp. avenae]